MDTGIDIKTRLDVQIVSRGILPTRELAKKAIAKSMIFVDGVLVTKPSLKVSPDSVIVLNDNSLTKYVSRGAYKLEAALEAFSINVDGMTSVDFGASTGGFTDVLLQKGAEKVYAIENGRGQLHERLLYDARVVSIENTNARYIDKGFIPLCDIAVMDVSFISQTKLYQSVTNVLKPNGVFISLIKPQFEAGKQYVSKNGIVKDESVRLRVLDFIKNEAELFGFKLVKIIDSPILGGDGNKEYLAYFQYTKGQSQ